jgi:putative transposase
MSSWIEKVLATRLKRTTQTCKVFELKIDSSHLSQDKRKYLEMLFIEAKWLYNHILSAKDIFEFNTKTNEVIVLNKDKQPEERTLTHLSSQMKQAVHQKLLYSIKSLSAKKKKKSSKRIGKIKHTSLCKSIVLNQHNITYRIVDKKYLKLQGSKFKFKINGYSQIPEEADIANATLLHRHNDFYLKITCFLPIERIKHKEESVGIDFGLTTTLTLSNGEKINLKYPENKRLRRSSRRLKKRVKYSKNYLKMKDQVNKEYHKLTNRKKDKKNKIVSKITKIYKTVIVQDENIKAWHSGRYGKSVQHSLMSGIMSDLERKSHTFVKVDKFFPSTQLCPVCGDKHKLSLSERVYVCNGCGYTNDRDTKSAICILKEGIKILTERKKSTLVEIDPLLISSHNNKQGQSLKQEAPAFRQG